jgi:hypothetical protein
MSTPRSLFARWIPSLASWLNERSLSPPMSVTRPTLSFLAAAGVGVELEPEEPDPLPLSEPHPAGAPDGAQAQHKGGDEYGEASWHCRSSRHEACDEAARA